MRSLVRHFQAGGIAVFAWRANSGVRTIDELLRALVNSFGRTPGSGKSASPRCGNPPAIAPFRSRSAGALRSARVKSVKPCASPGA